MSDTPVRVGGEATKRLDAIQELLGLSKKKIVEKLILSVDPMKVKRERRLPCISL